MILRNLIDSFGTSVAALCLVAVCGCPAYAEAAGLPIVLSSTVDAVHNTLTINGQNFAANPVIAVGAIGLTTLSSSSTRIVGSFPAATPATAFTPGDYFLTIQFPNALPSVFAVTIGAVGQQGPAGPQGPIGLMGAAGPVGPAGSPGPAGATGTTGPTGAQGPQGVKGDTGAMGTIGPTGPAGPVGLTGPTGSPSAAGLQGSTGAAGPQGLTGATGPQGVPGPPGVKGDTGMTGSIGPAGAVGQVGPAGTPGAPGAQGSTGPMGVQGLTGAIGPQGPIGPAGPQGLKGDTGATGSVGPAGPIGPQGSNGAIGATGATGPVGASGPTGPQGSQGNPGSQGISGPVGAQGPVGATGAQGPAGESGVGFTGTTKLPLSIVVGDSFYGNTLGYAASPQQAGPAISPGICVIKNYTVTVWGANPGATVQAGLVWQSAADGASHGFGSSFGGGFSCTVTVPAGKTYGTCTASQPQFSAPQMLGASDLIYNALIFPAGSAGLSPGTGPATVSTSFQCQ